MVVICYLKRGSGKALKIHINNYSFFELCALHHPPPPPTPSFKRGITRLRN